MKTRCIAAGRPIHVAMHEQTMPIYVISDVKCIVSGSSYVMSDVKCSVRLYACERSRDLLNVSAQLNCN